jgi:hypothetical protein
VILRLKKHSFLFADNTGRSQSQFPTARDERNFSDELKLKKGDTVFVVLKATEVMIQKDQPLTAHPQFQRRDLSHPTSYSLFIRDNDPVRRNFCIQWFSTLQEGKNNLFFGKVEVNLGKGDDGTAAL